MDEQELGRRLAREPAISVHPGLAEIGAAAFSCAVVLLDDDENLTRLGNPTGEAREALRERILALLGASEPKRASLDDVDLE